MPSVIAAVGSYATSTPNGKEPWPQSSKCTADARQQLLQEKAPHADAGRYSWLGTVKRDDARRWFQGPVFKYKASPKPISVNVIGSSWPIRGVARAKAIDKVLSNFKTHAGGRILDFGAGSWLRYSQRVRKIFPSKELHAVEFAEAFHDDAGTVRAALEPHVTFWTPMEFVRQRDLHFDLILLINVLNVLPEADHRHAIFATLARRLNPNGWLMVYQRIWASTEAPPNSLEYGDGWMVPQPNHSYYTYRARTGHRWFTNEARQASLRPVDTVTISSSNTILSMWERPF